MKDDSDNIKPLGITFKSPPAEDAPQLEIVRDYSQCNHSWHVTGGKVRQASYLMREGEAEVECGLCGTRLDPLIVLAQLARHVAQWQRHREIHQDEMKRLNERTRTKCQHCGKLTRISRR